MATQYVGYLSSVNRGGGEKLGKKGRENDFNVCRQTTNKSPSGFQKLSKHFFFHLITKVAVEDLCHHFETWGLKM